MRRIVIGGTLLALLAVGCSAAGADPDETTEAVPAAEREAADEPSTTTSAAPATTSTTSTTSTSTSTTLAPEAPAPRGASGGGGAGAGGRVSSDGTPTFPGDFADPDLATLNGVFYAYATNTLFMNVPVLSTEAGGVAGEALPELPAWSEPHHVWAPSVTEIDDQWVLHYTTRHSASGRQCISVAVGDHPAGPFVDDSTEPLVCALDQGGAIDPSVVFDSDDPYLLWKSDGNCCGLPTIIYSQPLSADGTELAGDPVELIRNDLSWERDVVEGPSMIEVDGTWWLFYSANRWDTEDYAVGLAECDSIVGPCEKQPDPWLSSDDMISGPGGLEVIGLDDRPADLVVYHAWTGDEVGYPDGVRALFVQIVRWTADGPVLVGR